MAIDIDQSFYRTGTATVAANGTAVTGQGTLWTQTCRAGDMFGTHVGDGTRILSIESNTSLTLAYPWKGAAQTASAYEIQFTPYDTGYQASVRELLLTMASGNVDALAGLTGAQNTMPYFTGAGTMDRTSLTAFARTLLSATDGAAGYAALGEVPNGRLPSRLRATAISINNLDNISETGFYWSVNGAVGAPDIGDYYVLHQQGSAAGFASQEAIIAGGSEYRKFSRKKRSGVWEAWYSTGLSILGNVSQSAGVPTGAIIQRGSNANGEFVRFADGTQICWSGILSVAYNNTLTLRSTWNFPSSFASAPTVSFSLFSPYYYNGTSSTPDQILLNGGAAFVMRFDSDNSGTIDIIRPQAVPWAVGDNLQGRAMAIGRWF